MHLTRWLWAVLCLGRLMAAGPSRPESWTTTSDLRLRWSAGALPAWERTSTALQDTNTVVVDPSRRFQTIYGMGASLEHTTCSNLARLGPSERDRALRLLVDPVDGIGMNLMRVCMGTSDFAGEDWYSYSEPGAGRTDPELKGFSIERDRAYVLPMIRRAKELNPGLRFFASPWSPPGWMKTTGNMIGGELKPEYYGAYAQYFVRFIQAYAAEGIRIEAVTVQNEPGVDRAKEKDPKWYYPSCHWTAEQERDFIRDHLGPALKRAGLKTRIWCYDHNYNETPKADSDGLPHPRAILKDRRAARFVGGVGFHHYEGQATGMSVFHDEFPKVPIHFTEGSVFSIWGGYDLVERFRNWAVSYNAWVAILDEKGRPNNGPFPATRAILRLQSDTLRVEEIFEYHQYGHFMKLVPVGSVRIGSGTSGRELAQVAFRTPEGHRVLVLVNTQKADRTVRVREGRYETSVSVPAEGLVTMRWK